MTRRVYYFDKETQTLVEGYPPDKFPKYGEAPFVIQDSMSPYYHPASCTWVDSKSALRDIDRACGTVTSDKKIPPNKYREQYLKEERKKDMHNAIRKAVNDIDNNMAPLTEDVKEKCRQENERISRLTGLDAFNVAGKKNGRRNKRRK